MEQTSTNPDNDLQPAAPTEPIAPSNPSPAPATPPPAEDIDAKLAKARQDEKNKAQNKINKLNTELETTKQQLEADRSKLTSELAEAQTKLKELEESQMTDVELREKREKEQTQTIEQLQKQVAENEALVNQVAENAQADIQQIERRADLKIFRREKISAAGLRDPNALPDNLQTEEEIEAAVAQQLEREETLRAQIEEEMKAKYSDRPGAEPPNTPLDPASGASPIGEQSDRRLTTKEMRGMSRDDFEKRKRERIEKARRDLQR